MSGVSSASAGRNGWAVPDSTATTDAVEPPPSCDDHVAQAGAERELADAGALGAIR